MLGHYMRGEGWDPQERYALIGVEGDYDGRFSDYDLYGALPKGYEGVLDYEDSGLWLAFRRLMTQQPPTIRHNYHELHRSVALSSYYFPESIRQHYMSQAELPTGLSSWVWHGGSHQRSHGAKLRQEMSYFGLNWQSAGQTTPLNLGLQFGYEHEHWEQAPTHSHLNNWVLGISAERRLENGLGWLIGAAHHRYRLTGSRENAQHRYHAQLTQLHGQIHRYYHYGSQQPHQKHTAQIGPVLQLRLMQLRTPTIRERGINAQNLRGKHHHYADLSLGLQGRWTLIEDKQQVRINHSLKYHHWLGSHPLPKGHISAQIGLDLQPNPQWQFGLNTQTRIGPGLRDQAISFNLTGVF